MWVTSPMSKGGGANEKIYYNYPKKKITFIDLGLPSGTLWASCNIGAESPEDAGMYFQWADTQGYTADQVGTEEGKKKFAMDWSDYKYASGTGETAVMTKYNETDGLTVIQEEDDAAVAFGGVMPPMNYLYELKVNCTWTAVPDEQKGEGYIKGFTATGPNGNSIFLPASGGAFEGGIYSIGELGAFWSGSVYGPVAVDLYLSGGPYVLASERFGGETIRPCQIGTGPVPDFDPETLKSHDSVLDFLFGRNRGVEPIEK